MTDLSVVIVSWNARRHLEACLRSVEATARDLRPEVIVVDNASTDGSVELVKGRFPAVRVICNASNLGYARACNAGIRMSQGRYVCILNSDVVVEDGCLRRLCECLDARPRAGLAGPLLMDPSGRACRSTMGFPSLPNSLSRAAALDSLFPRSRVLGSYLMAWEPGTAVRSVDVVNGAFWMLRREAALEVEGLDEGFFFYGEDIDLCRRLADRGWERLQDPNARAVHVGGASSGAQPTRFYLEMQRANLRYWRKHLGGGAARAYALVLLLQMAARLLGYSVLCACGRADRQRRYKRSRSGQALRWLLQNA